MDYSELYKRALTDDSAFEELYQIFFPRVYNFVYARVKNFAVTDDLVSEILTKVFLKLETFRGNSTLSTWIFRIASNEVMNYFRRNKSNREESWAEYLDRPSSENVEPEVTILATELNQELLQALDQLSERQQRIIELKYFAGLKHKEISEILDLSPSNIGYINFQAMNKLREILEDFRN